MSAARHSVPVPYVLREKATYNHDMGRNSFHKGWKFMQGAMESGVMAEITGCITEHVGTGTLMSAARHSVPVPHVLREKATYNHDMGRNSFHNGWKFMQGAMEPGVMAEIAGCIPEHVRD